MTWYIVVTEDPDAGEQAVAILAERARAAEVAIRLVRMHAQTSKQFRTWLCTGMSGQMPKIFGSPAYRIEESNRALTMDQARSRWNKAPSI